MPRFDPGAQLAARVRDMTESAILRMSRRTRELRARGADIVSLTLGEPDFDTPEVIREAACAALERGFTHYPPVPGLPRVRSAIAEKLARENGLEVEPEGIVVSAGAKQALANAILAVVDPGDEVILPAPYWSAYEILVRLAGGIPIVVPAMVDGGHRPDVEGIARALSPRSKMLIINTPCNPSGVVFTRAELEALAELVRAHPRLMVLADEIYEYILFDDARHVSIGALEGMDARTITVNGFSKGFAMTGWRLGYAAATPTLATAMAKIQGSFTAGVNAFAQHAAITALKEARGFVEEMRASYARRRALIMKLLAEVEGARAAPPQGTFYVLADLSALLGAAGRAGDDVWLAEWLLEEHGVATVPGSAFGAPGCLRLSFSVSEEDIREGLRRMRAALAAFPQTAGGCNRQASP